MERVSPAPQVDRPRIPFRQHTGVIFGGSTFALKAYYKIVIGAIFTSLGGAALLANHSLSPVQVSGLQHTFSHSFHVTFIVCAGGAAVGIFASLVRGKEQRNLAPKLHTTSAEV